MKQAPAIPIALLRALATKLWAWVAFLWWLALLSLSIASAVHLRCVDDGDPGITIRFGTWYGVLFFAVLCAAWVVEARRVAVVLIHWRQIRRTLHEAGEER